MTLVELARKLRTIIEKAAASLPDEDALDGVQLFPAWQTDGSYAVGDRVRYDGILFACLQAHTAQADWTPTAAPSLWARVLIPDPSIIPDWVQPDSTNPYAKGDKVRFNGAVYESLIDGNVWSPEAYPAGWQLVNE